MSWLRQVRRGWRVLSRREAENSELGEELQHFYEARVGELLAAGCAPVEARRRARLELGDPGAVIEDVRAAGWERFVDAAAVDLRQAVRRLLRAPGFTMVSVLTLAVGMGASAAIFSAVKPILLEPLPYEDPERLVLITDRATDGSPLDVTFGTYRELVQRSRSFESLATFRVWQPTLTGMDRPERLEGQRVGAGFFAALRVTPLLGRTFTDAEDAARGPNVVVLAHALWQRRFGGDRDILGRAVTLNDQQFVVVGVLGPDFENVLMPSAEVWAPLQYDAALPADGREWGHHLRMVGRLASGTGLEEARRELNQIAGAPLPDFERVPWAALERGLLVSSLRDDLTRGVRPALLAVTGAVLLLLAIACVNVTNLLLARGIGRRSELALRAALGAGRNRLATQLVLETVLLTLLGAAAGLVVAQLGVRALLTLTPPELPRANTLEIDGGVFMFAFGSAAVIGLMVGWFAARHAGLQQPVAGLQRQSSRVAGGHDRVRRALVIVQVAMAVTLLIPGGLLLRSAQQLFAVDPGFEATHVLTMQVQATGRRFDDDDATYRFFGDALTAARAVPGVRSGALTSQLPLSGDAEKYGVQLESQPVLAPEEDGSAFRYAVTADYFQTMNLPLRRGRLLEERDGPDASRVVVISESFARRHFPDVEPLGQRLRLGSADQPWSTVVGVVGDVNQLSLSAGEENAVYLPTTQSSFADRTLWLVVRTSGSPSALASSVREAIWSVDRDQPVWRLATMQELVLRSAAERRFTLVLFDAFAGAALLLAAIGLYGVLAGMVQARGREIGVRAALGASGARILGMVLRQGATLTGLGLAAGLLAAGAATRALESLLFGVSALDPVTYAAVVLLMLAVCGAASSVPALRAVRVHPISALRE